MDELTRTAAKLRLEDIQTELLAAHNSMEDLPTSALLECIVQSSTGLKEVAVSLLVGHLREHFRAGNNASAEQIVEDAHAILSRFFDIV